MGYVIIIDVIDFGCDSDFICIWVVCFICGYIVDLEFVGNVLVQCL